MAKRVVSFSRREGELGVNQCLVESIESGIVLVRQRAPSGNDVAILIVTDGLELPHAINKLQVTQMLTLFRQEAINAVIDPTKRQLTHGLWRACFLSQVRG